MSDLDLKCDQCGKTCSIEELDAKPSRLRRNHTLEDLLKAMESGKDFNRFECERCYGIGYSRQPAKGGK